MNAMDLCIKAYGTSHMLYVRLCLNIGILYEDDRKFVEAYDYFLKWDAACMEVRAELMFTGITFFFIISLYY